MAPIRISPGPAPPDSSMRPALTQFSRSSGVSQRGGADLRPGERVGPLLVVARDAAQRTGEGLRRELLGDRRVEPAAQVGMDGRVVAIEDRCEGSGLEARASDELGIAHDPPPERPRP
jgi:hypothetical protein